MTVQALPQGGTRGRPSQSQSAGEESVLAESLDGLKVSLSLAKQPHHSHEHIAVRDARAYGKGGIYQLRRLCEAMLGQQGSIRPRRSACHHFVPGQIELVPCAPIG